MKALTLQQPFATLGVLGAKIWETRPKPTNFRGRHLITSSAKWNEGYKACIHQPLFKETLRGHELPLGFIIGSIELTDCIPTSQAINQMSMELAEGKISSSTMKQALEFGDFGEGRFAYRWKHAVMFEKPIPCKGNLGFWDTRKARGSYAIEKEELPYLDHCLTYLGEHVIGSNPTSLQALIGNGIQGCWPDDVEATIVDIEKRLFKL